MLSDEFYELVYEAWRTGKNPDLVSEDKFDSRLDDGYCPDEITLNMVYPKQKEPANEK